MVCSPLQADEKTFQEKRMERMEIAMKAEAKPPAETVAGLAAPPASEPAALADLPEETARMLQTMYQWQEGDPLYLSTASMGEIQNWYADELAPLGYTGSLMLDENGKPISPAFTYGSSLGAVRVMAADDAVPEKTLVAVIVLGR
jgi:hypothetical protein